MTADPGAQGGRAITCPSCGGTIGIKAAGYTVSVACLYCGTVLDVANDDVRIIAQYHQAVATLDIPLGRRGVLFGVEWEAIGWLERSGAGAVWQEYLLFNPYAGYRWLVNSGGDWQFGVMLTDTPVMRGQEIAQWRGRPYELEDAPIQIATRRVLGEFYWRVRSGDAVDAASFAAGRDTLSCEWSDAETQWTHLVPLDPRQVQAAFAPSGPTGPRAVREVTPGFFARLRSLPFESQDDLVPMFAIGLVASVAALLAMVALAGTGGGFNAQTNVPVDGGTTHAEYGPMTINRPSQMVTVQLATQDFTNKWIDVDVALVDRQSHQAIRASTTIQHYSGSDSDGAWSEGSHEATVHLADVPRGAYNLVVEAQAHSWRGDNAVSTSGDAPAASGDAAATSTLTDAFGRLLTPQEPPLAMALMAETGGLDWALFWTVAGLILVLPTGILLYRVSQGRLT